MLTSRIFNSRVVENAVRRKFSSVSSSLTQVEFKNNVREITMSNEKTRNCLSIAMMATLIKNIKENEHNKELRVIVISGKGPVFSAGHNLKEMADGGLQVQKEVFQKCSELMNAIIDSPVPVIAKVNGIAAAAGCQLAAQCDIVICSDISTFSTPGANFGIFCSTPGVALSRNINQKAALHMLLTGLPITAQEARNIGLVTKVCASENLNKELDNICHTIISKSRDVVELGKRFFYKQMQEPVKKAYILGGKKMVENCQLPDGQEGMESFREKRRPKWIANQTKTVIHK